MKTFLLLTITIFLALHLSAQIDPSLLRRTSTDTTGLQMNMDAVYNRPFLQVGKLPVAIGGYAEANYQYLQNF